MLKTLSETLSGLGTVLWLTLLLVACSKTPKGIIPEKKMQKMLIDMQLAEAMITMDPATYIGTAEKKALYQSVFDKYQLTKAEYDSSLVWYGKHLPEYMQVYTLALANVKQQIADIGDIKPDIAPTSNADSLDIWIFRKYYEFSPHALSNTVIFDLQPDDAYSSGSVFVLGLQVWGITPGMKSPMEVHLCAYQGDTTLLVKSTVSRDGYHEFPMKTISTKRVKRVYGYIRLNETDDYGKIYLDNLCLMKYRYGSPAIERIDSLRQSSNDAHLPIDRE